MRLCKVGLNTFTWDGKVLRHVIREGGKHVTLGTYDPKTETFEDMDHDTMVDAAYAYGILSAMPPQVSIY